MPLSWLARMERIGAEPKESRSILEMGPPTRLLPSTQMSSVSSQPQVSAFGHGLIRQEGFLELTLLRKRNVICNWT